MPTIHHTMNRDIQRCKDAVESGDIKAINDLLTEFEVAYKIYWPDLVFTGPSYEIRRISVPELKGFQTRLESLLYLDARQLHNLMKPDSSPTYINNNSNSLELNVEIVTQIQNVINFIEEHSGMSDQEKDEAKGIVNELESISKSEDTKVKKWEKIKPILKWLSGRGLDITLKIIPIILQILK